MANRPRTQLSARERDVLTGIADGLTSRQIARRLGIAENTVRSHTGRLLARLGARNRAHAVHLAHLSRILGGTP